jgi:GNAT superfamily N-acetyltransferase
MAVFRGAKSSSALAGIWVSTRAEADRIIERAQCFRVSIMSLAEVSVRPATDADYPAISRMLAAFTAQHHQWQPEQFRPRIIGLTAAMFNVWLKRPRELHLTAEYGGEAAAYANALRADNPGSDFTYPRRGAYIAIIVVGAEHRRRGIGRALFRAVEDWASTFDAEFVGLHVNRSNDAARAFYTALTYGPDGEYRVKTLRQVQRLGTEPGNSTP